METVVQFNVGQLIALILGMCGGIVTISAAVTVLIKTAQKIKEPEHKQNERIEALEKQVDKFNKFFDNDNKRLMELEKGNTVTQQALLALLSHAINGNNEDELKNARSNLEKFLISRGGVSNETVKSNL